MRALTPTLAVSDVLSRRDRERITRRHEIMQAATEVFSDKGFTGATLDEIAERAEFSKGTLYNYFASKDDLFDAVLGEMFDRFIDIADEHCTDPRTTLIESLTGLATDLLRLLHERTRLMHLLMVEIHQPERRSYASVLLPDLLALLELPFDRARKAGLIVPQPTGRLAFLYLTLVLSLFQCTSGLMFKSCSDPSTFERDDLLPDAIASSLETLRVTFLAGILVPCA